MKAYVINLKHRTDRLEFFNTRTRPTLEKLGFDIEIFEAIDGSTLTDNEWEKGKYGCFASHVSVYRKAVVEGHESFAVFEDDVSLGDIEVEAAKKLLGNPPRKWDILYLTGGAPGGMFINRLYQDLFSGDLFKKLPAGSFWDRFTQRENPRWTRAVAACTTTAGMIFNTQFAKKILDKFVPENTLTHKGVALHIDWVLIKYAMFRPHIRMYLMQPNLLIQNLALDSDIAWYPKTDHKGHNFDILQSFAQKHPSWEYMSTPGGFGEAFSVYATFSFFDKHTTTLKDFNKKSKEPLIIIGGSDSQDVCDSIKKTLGEILERDREILILPITISKGHELFQILKNFPNLTLLAREKITHAQAVEEGLICEMTHDIVFSLQDTVTETPQVPMRSLLAIHKDEKKSPREDFERTSSFDASYDLSSGLQNSEEVHGRTVWNRENSEKFVLEVLEEMSQYSSLVTNHFHIGVLGSLLNKKVSYVDSKEEYVDTFHYSMQGLYPFTQMRR